MEFTREMAEKMLALPTPEQVERLIAEPTFTPEQLEKMFATIGPVCSTEEALFLNEVSVFTVRIYSLAQKMPADTGIIELDAVTRPAKVLVDLLLARRQRRQTPEELLLFVKCNKELTEALRHVGIAKYLSYEQHVR